MLFLLYTRQTCKQPICRCPWTLQRWIARTMLRYMSWWVARIRASGSLPFNMHSDGAQCVAVVRFSSCQECLQSNPSLHSHSGWTCRSRRPGSWPWRCYLRQFHQVQRGCPRIGFWKGRIPVSWRCMRKQTLCLIKNNRTKSNLRAGSRWTRWSSREVV